MDAAKKAQKSGPVASVPFHVFLARALDEAQLSNPEVAQRLGYPKPNVVSMMRTGSMKVPLNKLPELAQMLKMDALDLLMLALQEYDPGFLESLKRILGDARTVTQNEMALLSVVRSVMPAGEFNVTSNDDFVMALTSLVGREVERQRQEELRPSPRPQAARGWQERPAQQGNERAATAPGQRAREALQPDARRSRTRRHRAPQGRLNLITPPSRLRAAFL